MTTTAPETLNYIDGAMVFFGSGPSVGVVKADGGYVAYERQPSWEWLRLDGTFTKNRAATIRAGKAVITAKREAELAVTRAKFAVERSARIERGSTLIGALADGVIGTDDFVRHYGV